MRKFVLLLLAGGLIVVLASTVRARMDAFKSGAQSMVTVRATLVRVNSQLLGVVGPPISDIGVVSELQSVTDVEPMAAALRKTGLELQVRLEPVDVSFDEVERARSALRAAGFHVLPPASTLEVQLIKEPKGLQALITEPGYPPAPARIDESGDVIQLLSQIRMWAPKATVRLVPNEDVPTQQVQDITEALKKAGLSIGAR